MRVSPLLTGVKNAGVNLSASRASHSAFPGFIDPADAEISARLALANVLLDIVQNDKVPPELGRPVAQVILDTIEPDMKARMNVRHEKSAGRSFFVSDESDVRSSRSQGASDLFPPYGDKEKGSGGSDRDGRSDNERSEIEGGRLAVRPKMARGIRGRRPQSHSGAAGLKEGR